MATNIQKICSVIICSILAVLLMLPLLFFNRDESKISVVENKSLAKAPKLWKDNGKLNKDFIGEFEEYFEDNIGFKQEAVVADIAVSYSIFGKLKIPDYIEGKDGHVFYILNGLTKYQGTGKFSDEEIDIMVNGLKAMHSYFSSQEIPFIFMAIPDKDTIYPEYFPSTINQLSKEKSFDRFTESLREETDVDILYILDDLMRAKSSNLVYYRNYDPTHWNMNGAFVGYTALMSRISNYLPEINVLRNKDFKIELTEKKGTLAHLTSFDILRNVMKWEDVFVNYALTSRHTTVSTELPHNLMFKSPPSKYYHLHNDSIVNGKTLLIFGDSYIYSYLLDILAESFSDLYFISHDGADVTTWNTLHEIIKPDCVVFECVERVLNTSTFSTMSHFSNITEVAPKIILNSSEINIYPQIYIDIPNTKDNLIDFKANYGSNLHIGGWTFDPNKNAAASAIYFEIGGKYYLAEAVERPDIVRNGLYPDMLYAGFQINLNTHDLKSGDKISIIVCSTDGTSRFLPVEYILD